MNPLAAIGLLAVGAAVGGIVVFLTRSGMRDTFQSLSAQVLRESNTQFLDNARRVLDDVVRQSRGDMAHDMGRDLDQRREAIENMVRPVQEALGTLHGEIRKIEGRREEAFTGLQNEIARLQKETGNLTTALRRPQGRGLWGEITLRRVVESAGMSSHCDFSEQSTLEDREGRRYRPDLIVHLPGKHQIVVDSKTPLDAYLDAVNADTDQARGEHLARHAAQVRKQMELLSGKEYWSYLETSPEFVVLFLPGESFFSAALEQDRTLF
jgi:DNA recombination protein RmuC